jgi:Tfp pilus assembly protein PilO
VSLWRRVYVERRAVILPLLVVLVANIGVLGLAVVPLSRSVAGLEAEATDATFTLRKAQLADRQAKDARASKERADQELKKFYAEILPKNFTAARKLVALSFLDRIARELGLTFQRSQVTPADVRDSQLKRIGAKVTLSGDYQNIRKFLYAVETAEEFVIIERVTLSQAGDLRTNNSGALEVTLDVATYYLTNAAEAR